jgi:hypothetical protein
MRVVTLSSSRWRYSLWETTANLLTDESGNFLVDASGNQITVP